MKIPNKRELQQIVYNHSSDIDFKDFMKTTEEQVWKHVEVLEILKPEKNKELKSTKGLFPKEMRTNGIKNETDEIKKWKDIIKWKETKIWNK